MTAAAAASTFIATRDLPLAGRVLGRKIGRALRTVQQLRLTYSELSDKHKLYELRAESEQLRVRASGGRAARGSRGGAQWPRAFATCARCATTFARNW